MGRPRRVAGFHERQRNQHQAFFSSIHRARVTDTSSAVTKGTVSAEVENTDIVISVLAPLMSLSLPPKGKNTDGTINQDDDNGIKAGWGRYIPQIGDMLLVGFDTNGEPYALGYHAVYLPALDLQDRAASDRGGIGWGEESGVKLEPGDWDFMSKRNSRMMLTDKVQLSSGPYTFQLDQSMGSSTLTSTLAITQYGDSSEERQGSVQRFILPTDSQETQIYGLFGTIAQESTNVIKRGTLALPGGIEMARTSMGEVIDETTFLPMVPITSYPALNKLTGTGTRMLRSVKDPSGTTDFFTELVDDLGNYGILATTSTGFQWNTPAATWTVLNLATDWTSSTSFGITTPDMSITAASIALGGSAATDYLLKGTTYMTAFNVFLQALGALSGGSMAQNAAAITAIALAANALKASLTTAVSAVTKTV
jgi:hypothetical protein